jgi:Arc/MetJ-type ribon-helix-helix transcriptional regulator
MPEIRVTVTKELDRLLQDIVDSGMFASKADAMRAAVVYFLKDLGWLERPRKATSMVQK